ncbi:PE family protein [Mycobacterium haemophilum DSM 44634]|nr:PE family protein [Mycobacterium haemophilum DSM 44634]
MFKPTAPSLESDTYEDLGGSNQRFSAGWSDSPFASQELNQPFLSNVNAVQINTDALAEVSTKMVRVADGISRVNAQRASVITKIPPPGKDSVSALLARVFNARGEMYQVHTDLGAEIGKQFSWGLKDAASKYTQAEERNRLEFCRH